MRKHRHQELIDLTDDGAWGGGEEIGEVGAVNNFDLMAICEEEGACGGKGSIDDIQRRVIVELLRVRRTGRGGDSKNHRPDGREAKW